MVANNAGQPATPADLINVDEVIGKYYDLVPDPEVPEQRVIFGTSGHRGSSLKTSFNEAHIIAISQAIAEYRKKAGVTGPLYLGSDTHALSGPAKKTAIEVLVANGVHVRVDSRDDFVPTPVVSQAILTHNRAADGIQRFEGEGLADGIVVTPSHNPPTDGGFKYDPVTGGPAPAETTNAIAARANELLGDFKSIKRVPYEEAIKSEYVEGFDFREHYVDDLENVIDFDVIRNSGVRLGIDPLGGASVNYWPLINEKYGLNIGVVRPEVDPTWRFMTIDHDGKIRMDPSSPYAMKGLVDELNAGAWDKYDLVGGTDPDADRHGIVCPNWGVMNPNHYIAVCVEYLFGGNRPGWPEGAAVGKTLVSSSLIDRVAASINAKVIEVPVGFKWFVDPLFSGEVAFGGEESSGMSFLRKDGRVWTTDKDGLIRPAGRRDHCQDRQEPGPASPGAGRALRRVLVQARRHPDHTGAEGQVRGTVRRRRDRLHPGWRRHHRQADRGTGQPPQDRRSEGHHQGQLVRRPPLRHREHLQGVRRVLRLPRGSGQGTRRGHRRGRQGPERVKSLR